MTEHEPFGVTITGHYGDDRQCDTISIYFSHDEITREDIAAIVDAVVNANGARYEREITGPQPFFDVEKFNLNTRKEWFGN